MSFRRYVALGDSFTEGVGDPDTGRPNGVRGWADRVAEVLAVTTADFHYANLAIRGRKLGQVMTEQVPAAVAQRPDLVTMYAGGNDLLRPKVDIDALVERYDAAIAQLAATGAHIVLFTAYDTGGPNASGPFGALRGRFAVYNELVREVADQRHATVVDFWRMRQLDDRRLWDVDRMHLASAGHQLVAIAVLEALGIEHELNRLPLPDLRIVTPKQRRAENLEWTRSYLGPWVKRRITGASSGDNMRPKYPVLLPFPEHAG